MNIVIATTGTGGDLFPGIAVAEELRKGGHRMLFVVSGEQAAGTVRRAGYDCETMTTGRLMGEPPVRQLMTLAGLPATDQLLTLKIILAESLNVRGTEKAGQQQD